MKTILFVLSAIVCLALVVQSEECAVENKLSGTISDYLNANKKEVCWIIQVPKKHHVTINVESFTAEADYNKNGLELIEIRTGRKHTFTKKVWNRAKRLVFGSDVKVIHYARTYEDSYNWWSRFTLLYKIEKGYLPITVDGDPLRWGISWLKSEASDTMSWKENTPRAVVALHLASAANFNGTDFQEELMANQVEIKTSAALLKSNNTINELSMLVNSLLVTCYNPRRYHGIDVVQKLKSMVDNSWGIVHPMAYLALCNANETLPRKALGDLRDVLNTTSDIQVKIDMKAMAVMALSCYQNRQENYGNSSYDNTEYQDTIQHFKRLQLEDGSFGNVYTTALIAQALISDGDQDWDVNATDISDEIGEDRGPKIQIKYSLYIGDNKDVIHTIFLKVPRGFTAYQVMELAETQNPKYQFERKKISGKINVYEIANLPNDPESGKYWMLYVGSSNRTENIRFITQSSNEVVMESGQHLVMWYRSHNL